MAVITYEPETEITRPNITIARKYADGVHTAYHLTPNEGYVMHNALADTVVEVTDPDTGDFVYDDNGNIVTVTEQYYYRFASVPAIRPSDIDFFTAVLESEVPADMIFGGGNDHEVM